jgi:hypothetical protein
VDRRRVPGNLPDFLNFAVVRPRVDAKGLGGIWLSLLELVCDFIPIVGNDNKTSARDANFFIGIGGLRIPLCLFKQLVGKLAVAL